MGEKRGTEKVPIQTMRIGAFSRGLNTSVSRRDIADDEAWIITNFEFDDSDDLITRNGITSDGTTRANPIGSVYVFSTETGFIGILYNHSNNLVSRPLVLGAESNLGTFANAGTGRWYWKQLANVAVAATNGDTIQVVGGAPGTASVLAAAPDSRYIEEWESRLFLVHSANPNRVQCSDLGSAANWNTGGLTNPAQGITFDVAPGDGDRITGLFAFRERLFIFKRRRIYVLRATALPITDPNNWEVAEYSKNIGCVNQSTVREVFDDVLFLSEAGLCSLSAAEGTGDFASALISQKIALIQRLSQDATELDIFGFTLFDKNQYWLSLYPGAAGGTINFVFDYRRIKEGFVRWVSFSASLCPTAMDAYNIAVDNIVYVFGNQFNRIAQYIANLAPINRVFQDVPDTTPIVISASLGTKTYDMGYTDLRKLFKYWYFRIEFIKNASTTISISYVTYPTAPLTGGSYVITMDDIVNYDQNRLIRRAFKWESTRKGWAVDMTLNHGQTTQGIIIRNFGISYALLSDSVTEDRLT